jgi:hypothetical protein
MGMASECQIEEGDVRKSFVTTVSRKRKVIKGDLHGYQTKWNRKWHTDQTPYKALPMQLLALTCKPSQNLWYIIPLNNVFGKYDLELLVVAQLFCLDIAIEWGKTLQAPFLIRYPLQPSIAVLGQRFLPPRFGSLPFGPSLRYLVDGFLNQAQFRHWLLMKTLTVNQCSSRRDREEEKSHSNPGLLPSLKGGIETWLVSDCKQPQ